MTTTVPSNIAPLCRAHPALHAVCAAHGLPRAVVAEIMLAAEADAAARAAEAEETGTEATEATDDTSDAPPTT